MAQKDQPTTISSRILEKGIFDNIQRTDLNPIDRARSINRLIVEFNLTNSEIATRISKSPAFISNSLRLLELPDILKNGLVSNIISEGHARALAAITDTKFMIEAYKIIIKEKGSVRRAEQLARHYNSALKSTQKFKKEQPSIKIGVGGFKISNEEKQAVIDALDNNRLSYGPYAKKLESEFAKLHNFKYAIFCNSGTSALQVALHALKIKYKWQDEDEVLMPAINFIADPNITYFNRMKPVFVDVDPKTYNIDPEKIEAKITKKTRAIIPVHLCGLPADMEAINKIAKKHKLKVIEDCCETLLVKYKGQPVGSMSDISCFSTFAAHILITGVGGFTGTNNHKLAIIMKSLFNHGRDGIYISIDDDDNLKGRELFDLVDRRFKFLYPGYSYRATELEAAVGYSQLKTLKQNIKKRQQNASYLTKNLKLFKRHLQLPFTPKDREHAFMMYPVVVKSSNISRDKLIHFLESKGIETRLLLPVLNQPVIKKLWGDQQKDYPVANRLNKKAFYIGCHPLMTKKDIDYIIAKFTEFFKQKDFKGNYRTNSPAIK